ncbi:MAG TPA: hypothetical protein VF411_06975 [Bacteroidia bacterium]
MFGAERQVNLFRQDWHQSLSFRNKKVNTKKFTYNWSLWVKLIVGPGGRIIGGGTLTGHAGGLPTA